MVDDEGRALWQLLAEDQPPTRSAGPHIGESGKSETAVQIAPIPGTETTKGALEARGADVPDANET
jgi:hypothetical protein